MMSLTAPKYLRGLAAISGLVCCSGVSAADLQNLREAQLPHSEYRVLAADIELNAGGVWQVDQVASESVSELYLVPSAEARVQQMGVRMGEAIRAERNDQARWALSAAFDPCREYATRHDGVGPAKISDINRDRYEYVIRQWNSAAGTRFSQFDQLEADPGPYRFLVPAARFEFQDSVNSRVELSERKLLAFELRPYFDDGKHWVLYTDGSTLREDIDPARLAKYGVTVRPAREAQRESDRQQRDQQRHTLYLVSTTPELGPLEIRMSNAVTGETTTLTWSNRDLRRDAAILSALHAARRAEWDRYLRSSPAPVLRHWVGLTPEETPRNPRRGPGNELNMFSLLGGRAAIEETLQMQDIAAESEQEVAAIPLSSLRGVQVKSHPFAQMLAGSPGGRLPLADVIPHDRFFVFVGKPDAILPFLDHGTDFIAATGAALSGNRLDYRLTERYLNRMGITRPQLETVLNSGLVKEIGLFLPDLFVIDGTELTVVARLEHPEFIAGLMQLLKIGDLTQQNEIAVKTPDGRPAHWALRSDLLCISTNASELRRVLDLVEQNGRGSLGQSDEFRYMLTQLPVRESTRFYAYFSDEFIRRLVGPEVKIGQLRRMRERMRMEVLTAKLMQARLDGVAIEEPDDLIKYGYLPSGFSLAKYSIDEAGIVHSDVYGSLAKINTLPIVPLDRVTPNEAEAYQQYVENYSSYWRQFFDPIAVRLDDGPNGALELETFILPLLDSSIYQRVRDSLVPYDEGRPLLVPQLEPRPVVQFSVNVTDESWRQIARSFSEFFARYSHASPALLDDLGPSAHLAIFDADPVIALGSGDLMGAFGSNVLRRSGDGMLMAPVAMSVLTRPCTILVETRNPERTAQYLRQAAMGWRPDPQRSFIDFNITFHQVGDQDSWVWTLDLEGIIKLRFGIEVVDRYLVIRNIPWSTKDKIVQVKTSQQSSANLTLDPAACKLQLAGLFASASDQERQAALNGIGRLYPLLLSRTSNLGTVEDEHFRLFGFAPVHSPGGEWVWNKHHLASSVYGTPWKQRQPGFDPNRPFGLMQGIDQVELSMQLEDTGLRSTIVWRLRPLP